MLALWATLRWPEFRVSRLHGHGGGCWFASWATLRWAECGASGLHWRVLLSCASGLTCAPPSRAFSLLRTPNPQLLHHEVHSATSAFCTLLLLFATSCAMNFVLPPPPVSPRFFTLPHLPSDPLKPRFPRISACVHLRSCMCYLLNDQCNSAIRRPARQASPINLASFFRPSFGFQGALRQFGAQPD